METRQYEFRIDDTDSDGRNLSGLVAPFNRPTRINERGRTFTEVLKPGAFRDTINAGLPPVLYSHDRSQVPIAVCTAMHESDEGLIMSARLLQHPLADAVREALQAGAVKGASIGFNVPEGGDSWRGDSERTISRINLSEVSVTPWPAYQTALGVRAAAAPAAGTRALTRGQRARQLRALDLAALSPKPKPDEEEPPSLDEATAALAVVAKYLKSEQDRGSSLPPPE